MPPAPKGTLGAGGIRPVLYQTLGWPTVALLATTAVSICTGNAGWFTVGGAVISSIGAYFWAYRLFRLGFNRADDPLPPTVVEGSRDSTTGLVQLNMGYIWESMARAQDNLRAIIGVLLAIFGGILGSVVPFVAGLFTAQH